MLKLNIFKTRKINYDTQNLLLSIARQFIYVTPAEIDNTINSSLKFICEFLNVERGYIYLYNSEKQTLNLSHQYLKKEISAKINHHEQVNGEDFSWLMYRLRKFEPLVVNNVNNIPSSASTYKLVCNAEKIQSMLLCPLYIDKNLLGFVGVDTLRKPRVWHEEDVYLLNYAADIFSGAINRKRAVESGKQIEQKLRSLFSRSEDVVFIANSNRKFIEINPAGIDLFGYDSIKEILKIDIKNQLFSNPNDYDNFWSELCQSEHLKDYELKLKRKDGTELTVLISSIVLKDDDGNFQVQEGIIRDITDKKNLENQLFQSQKMESIGMLAGGIAHDFNNILTAMNGYADLVLMDLPKDNPNYKRVGNIKKGGKQAENLVKQLLAFSRKQFIETKVCNINEIIKELESILHKVIKEDILLKMDLHRGLNNIKVDPVQIQQILVNLIANAGQAIKQMDDSKNENTITLSTKEVLVDKQFMIKYPGINLGKYIRIEVKDTGIGMDKETLDKIFEPFFTTKKEGEGTGLGLATVYGIVKQNDAAIYVESIPQKGTSFIIFWPITKEKQSDNKNVDTQFEFKQRCETILFVEDDLNVRQLAADALISFGYEVYEAENGKHALEIIEKNKLIDKIDLMISDMVMPIMGGEELSRQIKKMNPNVKIILSSGYTNSQMFTDDNNKDNNIYFLSKPYTIPKLENKIRSVLQN